MVSLGCESLDKNILSKYIKRTQREVEVLTIQENGGTITTINKGKSLIKKMKQNLASTPKTQMDISELIIGTICGCSDGTRWYEWKSCCRKSF